MPVIDPEKQEKFALEVVERLKGAGFTAYWAGGCVRDRLLDRPARDYDVATAATPDQIRRLFGRRRTLAIGAAFGVITVLGAPHAGQIEVATFRSDSTYSDGRHPDDVRFTNAEEDALRRDFTINAMFFDPVARDVIDFVGGREDLERQVIRAVGDPAARFAEDKLRMLRAVRFAANLGFEIERETEDAIRRRADELSQVSAERVAAELRRMLIDTRRADAVRRLRATGLLTAILPESITWPDDVAWQHSLAVLEALDAPGFVAALVAWLGDVSSCEQMTEVARRWKLSNDERRRAEWLVEHHGALAGIRAARWSAVQPLLVDDGAGDWLGLQTARVAAGCDSEEDLAFCRQRLAWPAERLNPQPLITGDDLRRRGLAPGKRYRRILERVRAAQLDGELSTAAEALDLADRLEAGEPAD